MDEYAHIQHMHESFSRSIRTWAQVLIPSGAAIITFFVVWAEKSGTFGSYWDFERLLAGCVLFAAIMFYWRWVVHHIDRQIVELYPRMIQLEATEGWDIRTRYYFNNLAKRSLEYLCELLNLKRRLANYDDFVEEAMRQGHDKYDLLISVWHKYRHYSVTDRGHKLQDIGAFTVVLIFLIFTLWAEIEASALLALLLYILVIPWGQQYGWWLIKIVKAEGEEKK